MKDERKMKRGITRREVIRAPVALAGCACGCRIAKDTAGPRSTCCSTPDLEPESLWVHQDHLEIDLTKARSLCDVGGAWTRCPAYRSRTGSVNQKLLDAEVEPRLHKCDPAPQYPPYAWDDDRGFRCIRRVASGQQD